MRMERSVNQSTERTRADGKFLCGAGFGEAVMACLLLNRQICSG
jgi:hypothetical protein